MLERVNSRKYFDYCMGAKTRHQISLDLLDEFIHVYSNESLKLAFMHYSENSHDGNKPLGLLDNELYEFLKNNFESGSFSNTAIILYSDHGDRFNEDRKSPQGLFYEKS